MSEQVRQDLETTFDILETAGWCRKSPTPDGKVCLEAAVAQATMGNRMAWATRRPDTQDGEYLEWHGVSAENAERHVAVLDALLAEIPEGLFVHYSGQILNHQVWWWNDHHGTEENVKDLLRRTIKAQTGGAA